MSKILDEISEGYDDLKELGMVTNKEYQEMKKLTARDIEVDKVELLSPIQIKKIREKQLHLSQKALADSLYVTTSTVSKWENGKAKPSELVCQILKHLVVGDMSLPWISLPR